MSVVIQCTIRLVPFEKSNIITVIYTYSSDFFSCLRSIEVFEITEYIHVTITNFY